MEIKLWDNIPYEYEGTDFPNTMETYFANTHSPSPCVVVLPGGGYSHRAPHEGAPVAEFFRSKGIHAVVVNYRVNSARLDISIAEGALADAQRAIKILRANAKQWYIDPDRIVTLGFSAGGHLSASCSVLDDMTANLPTADEVDKMSARPNAAVLCYAAIYMKNDTGAVRASANTLLGSKAEKRHAYYSLETHVTSETPKAFIWHTSDDATVNIRHSLAYAKALRDHNVPFEMHVYPHGKHGLGLAQLTADSKNWPEQCANWILRNV